MSKRKNYFEVHKNKKPRVSRIEKLRIKLNEVALQSIRTYNSLRIFTDKIEAVVSVHKNLANSILKMQERQRSIPKLG